jgi:hypothetical protein
MVSRLPLASQYWRAVVLTALNLAQKVWHDECLSTRFFSRLIPEFSTKDLSRFEMNFLNLLKFNVKVTQQLYAQYYFELRRVSQEMMVLSHNKSRDSKTARREFPLLPLSRKSARRLEIVSDYSVMYQTVTSAHGHPSRPSVSGEQLPSRSRVVLS